MDKILGLPRNAAIVIGAVVVSAIAMAAGLFMPWGNNSPAPEDSGGKAIVVGPPPPAPPASPSAGTAPAAPAPAADSSLAGIQFKRITVDFDKLPGDQAMQAFSDAVSLQVDQGNNRGPVDIGQFPVTMHLKNAPYLEGLLQLAHDTRTMPQLINETSAILRPSGDAVGVWCVTGPLAIVLQRIQVSADLTRPEMPVRGMLNFDLYSEPSIKIAQYPATLTINQFEDENHQMLFMGSSNGNSTGGRNLPRASMQIPMSLPAEHGRKIAILRGSALFTMATRTELVETTGPDDTIKKTVGDIAVEILPIRPSTNGNAPPGAVRPMAVSVRYQRHVSDPEKWNRLQAMFTRIQPEVFDAADNPLQGSFYQNGQTRQGEDVVTLQFELRVNSQPNGGGAPEPHHVRFEFPAETRDVRLPFEFKDIILP